MVFALLLAIISTDFDYLAENPVNINFAPRYELMELPFLTPDQVDLIIKLRPFKNFEDFQRRTMIDPITTNLLRPYIYFSNLAIRYLKISGAIYKNKKIYSFRTAVGPLHIGVWRRDSLLKYSFYGKKGYFYIKAGNFKLNPFVSRARPGLYSRSGENPSVFADVRFVRLYAGDNSYYLSLVPIKFIALWWFKSHNEYAGLAFEKSGRGHRFAVNFAISNEKSWGALFYSYYRIVDFRARLKAGYFKNFISPNGDTLKPFLSVSGGTSLGPAYIQLYSKAEFLAPEVKHSEKFSVFLDKPFTLTFTSSNYSDITWRKISIEISNKLDSAKVFLGFRSPGAGHFAGLEFTHRCITLGFGILNPDSTGTVNLIEKGVWYRDYVSTRYPLSRAYLMFKKTSKNFGIRLKIAESSEEGPSFSAGGYFRWRL